VLHEFTVSYKYGNLGHAQGFETTSSLTKLKFWTFLGGSGNEGATINVDESGDIVGVGATTSADCQTTPGAYSAGLKGRTDYVIFKVSMAGRRGSLGPEGLVDLPGIVGPAII
jgi:hypothetical protein